jgi:hypothetical protein
LSFNSIFELQFLSADRELPELLRQAEEKSLNLRREVDATVKSAAVDQLKERLVRSVFAKCSRAAAG